MNKSRQILRALNNKKLLTKSYATDAAQTQFRTASISEPIETPFYDLPEFLTKSPATQITTLSNGVRIVTEPRVGETAAVGVYIKAGSRQENKSNNGVAHFLEHMYFKG